jgi:hypothetical protein
MDNDTTTVARVHASVDPTLKKSDQNHTKKSIIGALIDLGNTHKNLKNVKVRDYVVRCIMYAIKQHQNDPAGLRLRLEQVVPHIYGNVLTCHQQISEYRA